jgi:hypothetical protein
MIKLITYTLLTATTFQIFNAVNEFHDTFPQPLEIKEKEDYKITETKQALTLLGKDLKFAEPIVISARAGGIDPVFWACNIFCESEFKITAKSPKGYKGLAQTPKAVMKTGFEVADLTYGACVYKEKLTVAKGNKRLAMALYKGGNNPQAIKDANKVFVLHEKISKKIKELNEQTKG